MKVSYQIHPIQGRIINNLIFMPKAKFGVINTDKVPTDQFSFHVRSLVEAGLIYKNDDGEYALTATGKEFSGRMDTDKAEVEKQAKLCVVVHCKVVKNGVVKFLLHERKKQPYFGFVGPCGGKVRWGETTEEAAKRELWEETGLVAQKVRPVGIKHKMDYDQDGQLLEDKFFITFVANKVSGKLREVVDGGRNTWYTLAEIAALPLVFDDFDRTMAIVDRTELKFTENKYKVKGF